MYEGRAVQVELKFKKKKKKANLPFASCHTQS